jgi:putative transposase
MELVHRRTCVYEIAYHFVFCVKYRKKILKGKIDKDLKTLLIDISKDKGFIIEEMETDGDHVHCFVSAMPHISASQIIKWLKGISARKLFVLHPKLKEDLYKGHLWNPSYYVGTIGHISEETIKQYIRDQKVES